MGLIMTTRISDPWESRGLVRGGEGVGLGDLAAWGTAAAERAASKA